MGNAVVQSAMVVDDVVDHPCRGRSTYDKDDIVVQRSPRVPEIAQSAYEPRPRRVETRQLVYVDDTPSVFHLLLFHDGFQHFKSFKPGLWLSSDIPRMDERSGEGKKLFVTAPINDACGRECEVIVEIFLYEKGFSYASATINGYKLGLPRSHDIVKLLYFNISTDKFLFHMNPFYGSKDRYFLSYNPPKPRKKMSFGEL